jgi:uncharacterized protein YjbI with pentapeptide repeats
MYKGKLCERQARPGNRFCILHCDEAHKYPPDFQEALDKVFAETGSEIFDLTAVQFPKKGWKIPIDVIDKPIFFNGCVFHGDLEFTQICKKEVYFIGALFKGKTEIHTPTIDQFESLVSFEGARFAGNTRLITKFLFGAEFTRTHFEAAFVCSISSSGAPLCLSSCTFAKLVTINIYSKDSTDFSECDFQSDAYFRHSVFLGTTNFFKTSFNGQVDFRDVKFGPRTDSPYSEDRVTFSESTFSEAALFSDTYFGVPTDFSFVSSDKPDRIAFRDTDLSKVSFNGTDISKFEFYKVKWAKAKGRLPFRRDRVCDEIMLNKPFASATQREDQKSEIRPEQYESVAQTYRRLQQNYGNSYRYTEAGDFYIGEQEMVRKGRGRFRRFFCLNFLYKIVANYGENYWLPLVWLAAALLLSPALFMYRNMHPDSSANAVASTPVNCDWSWNSGDVFFLNGMYWKTVVDNLGFMTFSRTGMFEYFPDSFTRFLVITESITFVSLVTLFLLSLRRKFKRKSF